MDNGYLFQGDMVMSKQQIQSVPHGRDVDYQPPNAFSLKRSNRYRWSVGVVPFCFFKFLIIILEKCLLKC